jgi:NitT/TauT family transport system substrate-binding protein
MKDSFLSRRRFAVLFTVGALALTGCGASGSAGGAPAAAGGAAESDSAIRLTVFPSLNALGARVAEADGFFEDAGVKVELTAGPNAAAMVPQMIGGSIDIALMDVVTPTVARSQRVPLVMVAPAGVTTEPDKEMGRGFGNLFVRADSDIKSVKDLEGHSIGLPQINSQPWVDARALVDANGGDSSKLEFIEVPNTLAALEQGQVDAITVPEPSGVLALSNPKLRLLGPVATEDRVGHLDYAYVTTEDYLKKNPEKVKKFAEAILKANAKANEDEANSRKVAEGFVDVDPKVLAKAVLPTMATEPVKAADLEAAVGRMAKYGLVEDGLQATIAADMLK